MTDASNIKFSISDERGFGHAVMQYLTMLQAVMYPGVDYVYDKLLFDVEVNGEKRNGTLRAIHPDVKEERTLYGATVFIEVFGFSLGHAGLEASPNDYIVFQARIIDKVIGERGELSVEWNQRVHHSAVFDD